MVLGLVGLLILWAVSRYYDLFALSWLLQNFFDYLIIILIVLFQDQIRSALVSLSSSSLFAKNQNTKLDQQIEEVIDAVMALSRENTGALIVFERKQGLYNFSSTGTRLNCKIHSDIIYSIFQQKSPLHDGAIIIFNNTIQSAGCFLPLSRNVDIDRHYGTRHRAALGVTEISDAVVVTVSEETSRINICVDGKFHMMEDESVLRKNLRYLLLSDVEGIELISTARVSS